VTAICSLAILTICVRFAPGGEIRRQLLPGDSNFAQGRRLQEAVNSGIPAAPRIVENESMLSRRLFLGTLSCGTPAFTQGVASRGVKPQPRGRPSASKFPASFHDIAASAGLRAPVIYGGTERKEYILETVGCGCAFFDYDNDGWIDVFIPNGTRIEGSPAGTTNRLYKNNRDGTFTNVTLKAGLQRTGWACGVCIGDYNMTVTTIFF
jgi:enediyne biosynthesis protein E4